jgi:hypothetical protein
MKGIVDGMRKRLFVFQPNRWALGTFRGASNLFPCPVGVPPVLTGYPDGRLQLPTLAGAVSL